MQSNNFLDEFNIFYRLYFYMYSLFQLGIGLVLVLSPVVLSIWNIVSLILVLNSKNKEIKEQKITKIFEVIGILSGLFFTPFALHPVTLASWWQEIDVMSLYPPIASEYFFTFTVLSALGLGGYYILRFIPLNKQSPLITVLSISAMYYTMILCFVFCIQIFNGPNNTIWWLALVLPINIIILFTKVILLVVKNKSDSIEIPSITEVENLSNKNNYIIKLESYLKKSSDYPKLALILLLPMLVIIVIILILFGQKPDSLVAMWTDTAEWNLSTKIPPPRLDRNGHYLCTVAVCGSPNLVKPLWVGNRAGRKILVNRQLAIANAFEQIIQEKTPKFHKLIRGIYDKTGYPISKHITSKSSSNLTYIIMKPLEWCFVFVLYLVDVNPENRIYSQYRGNNKINN